MRQPINSPITIGHYLIITNYASTQNCLWTHNILWAHLFIMIGLIIINDWLFKLLPLSNWELKAASGLKLYCSERSGLNDYTLNPLIRCSSPNKNRILLWNYPTPPNLSPRLRPIHNFHPPSAAIVPVACLCRNGQWKIRLQRLAPTPRQLTRLILSLFAF